MGWYFLKENKIHLIQGEQGEFPEHWRRGRSIARIAGVKSVAYFLGWETVDTETRTMRQVFLVNGKKRWHCERNHRVRHRRLRGRGAGQRLELHRHRRILHSFGTRTSLSSKVGLWGRLATRFVVAPSVCRNNDPFIGPLDFDSVNSFLPTICTSKRGTIEGRGLIRGGGGLLEVLRYIVKSRRRRPSHL